jgi:hypothetical protein
MRRAEARSTFRSLHARGLVARGTVKVRAKVPSVKSRTATVYDCNSTSNFLAYDANSGELRDKSSGRSNGKTVDLVLRNGTCKVADTATEVGKMHKVATMVTAVLGLLLAGVAPAFADVDPVPGDTGAGIDVSVSTVKGGQGGGSGSGRSCTYQKANVPGNPQAELVNPPQPPTASRRWPRPRCPTSRPPSPPPRSG